MELDSFFLLLLSRYHAAQDSVRRVRLLGNGAGLAVSFAQRRDRSRSTKKVDCRALASVETKPAGKRPHWHCSNASHVICRWPRSLSSSATGHIAPFFRSLPQPLKIVAAYVLVHARRIGRGRRTAVAASTQFAVPREDFETLRDIQRVRALRVVKRVLADFVAELCIPGLQSEPHQLARHILKQASAGSDIDEFVDTRLVGLTKRGPSGTASWLELGVLCPDQGGGTPGCVGVLPEGDAGQGSDHSPVGKSC